MLENPEDEVTQSEAPLMEHLIELRTRLIYSFAAIAVLFVVCFFLAGEIYAVLLGPFVQAVGGSVEDVSLIYTAPQEAFFTELKVALFGAIFLASRCWLVKSICSLHPVFTSVNALHSFHT